MTKDEFLESIYYLLGEDKSEYVLLDFNEDTKTLKVQLDGNILEITRFYIEDQLIDRITNWIDWILS
jgi:hypothetical protein